MGIFGNTAKKYPDCKSREDWFYKANSLIAENQFDEAIICFDEALKLDPKNPQIGRAHV